MNTDKIIGLISILKLYHVHDYTQLINDLYDNCGQLENIDLDPLNAILYEVVNLRVQFTLARDVALYRLITRVLMQTSDMSQIIPAIGEIFKNFKIPVHEYNANIQAISEGSEPSIGADIPASVQEIFTAIYGLFKFALTDDISTGGIDKVLANDYINKSISLAFIGLYAGYTQLNIYEPDLEVLTKLIKYTYGERTRKIIGILKITKDGRTHEFIRYMHISNHPVPQNMWHSNNLPPNLRSLADIGRVSYVEFSYRRFPTLIMAIETMGEVKKQTKSQIDEIDMDFILAGINNKLASE